MLGEFFGITGAMSALLELSNSSIIRLSSVMNNPLDVDRLRKFRTELLYLTSFIDTQLEMQYSSPQIRRLYRQIKLIEENNVNTLKRSYKIDISEMSEDDKKSLIKDIENNISEIARETGDSLTLVNSFVERSNNNRVTLGDHEVEILKSFKTYYRRTLEDYIKRVKLSSFKEITVMGEELHRVAANGPGFLLSVVERLFDSNTNKDFVRRLCLEGIEIIRAHFVSETEVRGNSSIHLTSMLEDLDFVKYMTSSLGLAGRQDIPEYITELGELFNEEKDSFVITIDTLIKNNLISVSVLEELIELYYKVFRLDHDYRYLSDQLFIDNPSRGIGFEEIDSAFSNLNRIGFYYMNRFNSKLFLDSLNKISFSSESRTVIYPDNEVRGLTFREVVDDIETLCLSMIDVGENIEGVDIKWVAI